MARRPEHGGDAVRRRHAAASPRAPTTGPARLGRSLAAAGACALSVFCLLVGVGCWITGSPAPHWFPFDAQWRSGWSPRAWACAASPVRALPQRRRRRGRGRHGRAPVAAGRMPLDPPGGSSYTGRAGEHQVAMSIPAADVAIQRHRFTVDDFVRMGDAGILTDDDRVELLDGEVRTLTPINPPHAVTVSRLNRRIVTHLGARAYVSVQSPIQLDRHNQPQPDSGDRSRQRGRLRRAPSLGGGCPAGHRGRGLVAPL